MDGGMRGRCLCGGVTVEVPERLTSVGTCHCDQCRRWCSGPWMSLRAPPATRIAGETLRIHRSSRFAERGFCDRCGSSIFHRPVDGPDLAISAGLFDPAGFTLDREIFHDRKPPFYAFGGTTAKRSALSMAIEWAPRLAIRALRRRIVGVAPGASDR